MKITAAPRRRPTSTTCKCSCSCVRLVGRAAPRKATHGPQAGCPLVAPRCSLPPWGSRVFVRPRVVRRCPRRPSKGILPRPADSCRSLLTGCGAGLPQIRRSRQGGSCPPGSFSGSGTPRVPPATSISACLLPASHNDAADRVRPPPRLRFVGFADGLSASQFRLVCSKQLISNSKQID